MSSAMPVTAQSCAARFRAAGDIALETICLRPPGPGEACVRLEGCGVCGSNLPVWQGRPWFKYPLDAGTPGHEGWGVIEALSEGMQGFAVGDRVTGTGLFGAFAEEVAVPAAGLSRIPDEIDDRTAAAFGVAYRTAYHTLRSMARVGEGDDVVVLGAGGGVGLAAVQLAVQLGASVTAAASSDEKLDVAAHYGAKHVINHKSADLRSALKEAVPGGADVVIDPVGGELSEPALRSLGRGGRFLTVGFASGVIPRIPLNLVLVKGIHVLGFQFQDVPPEEFARNENELRELLVSGRVQPHIGAVYSLNDTVAALQHVADGRAIGKVLIDLT